MPPYKKKFEQQNKKEFKPLNELFEEVSEKDYSVRGKEELFIFPKHQESLVNYYTELNEPLEFVSSKDNADDTIKALVDSFNKTHAKKGISLDTKQIKYYMTNYHTNDLKDKRKELENSLLASQAASLKKGKEKAPWEFAKESDFKDFDYKPTSSNYSKMYFGLLKTITSQLNKSMANKSLEERKQAINSVLYDFGETTMGIFAACGGLQINDPGENYQSKHFKVKNNAWLSNPMFGDASSNEEFEKKLYDSIPADFLRDKNDEIEVDLENFGNDKNKTFELGEMKYIANQYESSKKQYDSHWGITKFFASLPIFKNVGLFKTVNNEAEKLNKMENVAKTFAPPKEYVSEKAKLNAGVSVINDFLSVTAKNTINEISRNLHEEAKAKMENSVDGNIGYLLLSDEVGLERFRTISLSAYKHYVPGAVSRSYASFALKKIATATNCNELDVESLPTSSSSMYGKITGNRSNSYLVLKGAITGDKVTDENGNVTYEADKDGRERFDYWMSQIYKGILGSERINVKPIKDKATIDKELSDKLEKINANYKHNVEKNNIKIEENPVNENNSEDLIKPMNGGSKVDGFGKISVDDVKVALDAVNVDSNKVDLSNLEANKEKPTNDIVENITIESLSEKYEENNLDSNDKEKPELDNSKELEGNELINNNN